MCEHSPLHREVRQRELQALASPVSSVRLTQKRMKRGRGRPEAPGSVGLGKEGTSPNIECFS